MIKKLAAISLILSLVSCSSEYIPEAPNRVTFDTLTALGYSSVETKGDMIYSDELEIGYMLLDNVFLYGYQIPVTLDDRRLSLQYIPQEDGNMCWAACTAMLINQAMGTSLTAFDISAESKQGGFDDIQEAGKIRGCTFVEQDTPLSFADIKSSILDSKPLMLTVRNDNTYHDVICYGYREAEGVQGIWILDPIDERHGGLKILTPDFIYGACHREGNTLYHTMYVWEKTRYIK